MTKKVKKWLDMLPEDIREKAIKAHKETGWFNSDLQINSLADFLDCYFRWYDSDDCDYWAEICDKAKIGGFDKPSEQIVDPITNNEIGKSGSAAFSVGAVDSIFKPLSSAYPLFTATNPPGLSFNSQGLLSAPQSENKYDYINPYHYKNSSKEVIDMMMDIWGKDDLIKYCEMCSFKYRMRLGLKPGQPIEQDLEKAKWYESKAKELRNGK